MVVIAVESVSTRTLPTGKVRIGHNPLETLQSGDSAMGFDVPFRRHQRDIMSRSLQLELPQAAIH
jgi:hypothetical protein